MVVSNGTKAECITEMDIEEHSAAAMSVPTAELLHAKREPSTDSPKRCQPVSARLALAPVDEEPSSFTETKRTMVDRGVGPTPVPPDIGDAALLRDNRKAYAPPFIPSASPLEQSAYHQSLAYYYAAAQVAALSPLSFAASSPVGQPLSSNTHEGRYFFNHGVHHPSPARMVGSPTQSDISLFSNPALVNSMDRLAAQMHWDHSHRHLHSPFNFGDSSKKSVVSTDIPATPGSGSITLPPSLNSSRLTSPRPSLVGGKGRKRALSHSPLSEFLDIQSLTRSSEGSLHLTPLLHNTNSRSSSVASGSYGHLSAGSLASMTPTLKSASPFFHAAAAAAMYPGLQLPFQVPSFQPGMNIHLTPSAIAQQHHTNQKTNPSPPAAPTVKYEDPNTQCNWKLSEKGGGSAVVSSTVSNVDDHRQSVPSSLPIAGKIGEGDEEQQDFKETICRWEDCSHQYSQHDDLVKHVNQDHISSNRKTFICRWRECCREGKPFKAQYMLVVHMRRHTGEKPHKCQGFLGCNKAYSRLENLKTHLRSHTGERPYLCEFPGCQKAFSNASDRAKHQNRTHSNEKPYACEIDGCSKRYTDPSSLRKHVKTVHGAEFYARKKHKGLDTPGCKANNISKAKANSDSSGDKKRGMEECLTVTGLGSSNERRASQDNIPLGEQQGSPQSDIDVEINVMKEETVEVEAATNPLSTLQEAVDEEESVYNDQQEDGGSSVLVARGFHRPNARNLKSKLGGNQISVNSLPSLANVLGPQRNKQYSIKDTTYQGNTNLSISSRKLPEIIEPANAHKTFYGVPRRDSNTSTLSSYMSSLRSDASTALFNSRFSSRRSSEVSQNSARLSIINSPYEYDMSGNLPERGMKELNSMTDQMEKAKLGSQPNLCVHSQSINLLSPIARRDALRKEVDGCYRRRRENEGWRTATPAHTPLPHEYPQYERRRASDPVRCADPSFNELKKLQQRFHSLNTMRPLPIPHSMKSLRQKQYSHETFQSSQSSIATNGYDGVSADYEANLNMKMIEDNEDVIIPDDMRHFLQQQRQGNSSHNPGRMVDGMQHHHQDGTTPSMHSVNGSVDQWVQQTNSVQHQNNTHHTNNRQLGYLDQGPPPYSSMHNYSNGVAYDNAQTHHGLCGTAHCGMMDPSHGVAHHHCYPSYPVYPAYQQPHMCQALHVPQPPLQGNQCSNITQVGCNQQCLMPPPAPINRVPQQTHNLLQVRTGSMDEPMRMQFGSNLPNPYQRHGNYNQHQQQTKHAQQQQAIANQQLSPPCEVSSSTDRSQQVVRGVNLNENILDNISSISAELNSQVSQNFSSVSHARIRPADESGNMAINNMSSVLSHFQEENKYLNSQQ